YIERSASYLPSAQSIDERGLIDQRAATNVDQAGAGFHQRQTLGVRNCLRAIRDRRCQHDVIRLPKNLVDLGWSEYFLRAFTSLLWMLPYRDHAHAQSPRTLGDRASDAAQAHNADGCSRNFSHSRQFVPQDLLSPNVLLLQSHRPRNFLGQRENERNDV